MMDERDRLMASNKPKDIYDKKNLEAKLETLLDTLNSDLKAFEKEFESQKKKKGKYDKNIGNKEEMKNLMMNRYQIIRNRLDGVDVSKEEIEDNRSAMEKLDDVIAASQPKRAEPERELYEEEKQKMEEWKKEVEQQDKDLDEIGDIVKQIHAEVKLSGEKMEDVHKQVQKVSKHTDASNAKLVSQNEKLKDLHI